MNGIRVELQFMAPHDFTLAQIYKDEDCVLTKAMYSPERTLRALDKALCRDLADNAGPLTDDEIAEARACIERLLSRYAVP